MRKMKDSGIEWIGEIPNLWVTKKIKNVVSMIGSGTTPSSEKYIYYENGNICWIQSGDIYGKNEITKSSVLINKIALNDISTLKIYKHDFIIMAMYGGSVGNISISKIDACVNQACCCIKPDNNNDTKFMYYWLLICKTDFLRVSEGGTQPNISQNKIKNQYYIQPPIEEQKAISAYLDEKCTEIDSLISDIQQQIETLEQYKRSVITEAVTKGINPDVDMRDSGIEWIGDIPTRWSVKKLKYITVQRNEKGLFKSAQDIYIGLENIKSYSNTLLETFSEYEDSVQSICHIGDIMFNKLRPYLAKVIISPYNCFCTGEFLQFCSFNGDNRFLRYFMLSDGFIEIVNASTYGTKMPRANTDFIINLLMTYPTYAEQKQIADYLDKKCAEIDSIISEKKQQIETIEEYKKSLIFEYVTGKKEIQI